MGDDEADFAERMFEKLGVPRDRIAFERQSRNTDENAVFTGERNEVSNRAERDEIQKRLQIEFRRAGQTGFASAFDKGMSRFGFQTCSCPCQTRTRNGFARRGGI